MDTYNVDIWLPDKSEYPELDETSRKVKASLYAALGDVQEGNTEIKIQFKDKVYKRGDESLNIDSDSVAAISFSEDFAKKYHWSAETGDVAVLAMMGGELPSPKNFFRLGFSVETIAAILGDQVVNDRRVSHVFLIRVKNELGEKFEEEFKRKLEVSGQNCSLDILEIDANVTKDTKGQSKEAKNNEDGNILTTTHTEFARNEEEKKEQGDAKVESVISQWLSNCIQFRKGEGEKSVVIYGYWEGYWDFVKEVLRCKNFNEKADWLYVESNYPLHASFQHNVERGVGDNELGEDKQKVLVLDEGRNQTETKAKGSVDSGVLNNYAIEKAYIKEPKGSNKVSEGQDGLTADEFERVRCFTGKLVEKESSFNTFARETVHLLWDAITGARKRTEQQGQCIQFMREGICEFLQGCKFYESAHLGSFFFRKDGELFFPLYRYSGNLQLGREVIVRESCCKEKELTKEAIADQLLRLSDSLNEITGANIIPRNLEIKKDTKVANVFRQFSEMIAKISNGIEIDFVSNYPDTKRIFYTWPEPTEGGGNKSFPHVSIFDEASKIVKGVIQINLNDFDLEDNNAYRVYLVYGDKNKSNVSTLMEWAKKHKDESEPLSVRAVVFAKSRIRIDEGKNYKDNSPDDISKFLSDFKKYRESMAKSNANFLYFIPEYISEGNDPEGKNSLTKKGVGGWPGGIFITTRYKLSLFDLQIIENMVSRIFSVLKICIAEHDALLSNIKSAIGSIMSRNGSHNIGSHVLAALSHNVGTMPDDRVLYQYIQHRMDYIATATTERPQWRQPTMIVSSLMKEFLMQRHLLDHISGSEGLHAYKFQGQSIDDNDKNTIRMHIRRVRDCAKDDWERKGFLLAGKRSDERNVVDFIDYDKSEIINPDEDVTIAVPGGVVGNHAFYTIIENVLRNAAKHEWAEAMRVWKMACELLGEAECLETYKECQPENLNVYVDFFDKPEEGKVRCRIWNDCVVSVDNTAKIKTVILRTLIRNCDERKDDEAMWEERLLSATKTLTHLYSILNKSDSSVKDNELYKLINCMAEETAKKEAIISGQEKEKFDKDIEWRKAIVLGLRSREEGGEYEIEDGAIHDFLMNGIAKSTDELQEKLEGKIKLSFIDESTGSLRKENWGIAEMRISAGYLQCRGTGHIGGLPGAGETCNIIRPELVEKDDNDKCVAYLFDIDKPKLLLVVLKSWHDIAMLRKNSMRFGVDFICREDLKSDVAYPYSYILFEHLDNELKAQLKSREIMLPYRQMYASIDGDGDGLEEYIPNYTGSFFKRLEYKFTKLQESGESAAKVCYELIEEVYATWLLHVQKRGFLPRATDASPKEVVLDIGGDSSNGSGQTLISQYELLKFVFENSFNAATRSFLKENGPEGGTGSLEIENQKGNVERLIVSLPSKIAAALYAVSQMRVRRIDDEFSKRVTEGWTVPQIVNMQLNLWMEEVISDDKKVCINLKETDQHWARQFKKEFSLGSARSAAIEVGSVADLNDSECDYWLGRFEDYISSTILDQAETFLSKYEERYVTLPKMLELQSSNVVHPDEKHCKEFLWNKQKLTIVSDSKERSEKRSDAIVNQDICYFRHGTAKQKTIGDNYYEPLSGSQSTFNVFRSVYRDLLHSEDSATHCKIAGFYTRLVENAATRILIVDERVAKFVRDHSEVGDILGGLRIAVADDTDINVMRMFSSEQIDDTLEFSKVELKKFEIVIIHQGIIDKLLHGHEDKYRVRDWLDKLVEKLHYVVITTGRGSPSNIPDTARVLPYSVIENSILQRFPEKMLLVDAIMNILPVRKGEK